jgi:hypothetical protein
MMVQNEGFIFKAIPNGVSVVGKDIAVETRGLISTKHRQKVA